MEWYRAHRRDLPWRNTTDPYAIWVSEVMLQQTRVQTVIPYYHRFLARFPNIEALARAGEPDVLAAWAGLGYYSRVRNMRKAARGMVENGGFPPDYGGLRNLPGIGDYTAAAVSSIAFGEPRAAVDGNVARVVSRITNDAGDIRAVVTRTRFMEAVRVLLDRRDPGTFNQAMMELGATVCVPAQPRCLLCPVASFCEARKLGRERELPVNSRPGERRTEDVTLLIVERGRFILLRERPADSVRLAGFWELPDKTDLPTAKLIGCIGEFRHSITDTDYRFCVWRARVSKRPGGWEWVAAEDLGSRPVSTTSRKALACYVNPRIEEINV